MTKKTFPDEHGKFVVKEDESVVKEAVEENKDEKVYPMNVDVETVSTGNATTYDHERRIALLEARVAFLASKAGVV